MEADYRGQARIETFSAGREATGRAPHPPIVPRFLLLLLPWPTWELCLVWLGLAWFDLGWAGW